MTKSPKWSRQVRLVPETPSKLPPEIRNTEFWIEYIDAERGVEYSALSDGNVRPLNARMAAKYRRDIENSTFMFNGEPICFVPRNGKQTRTPQKQRLGNGQHRIRAAAGMTDPDAGYYSLVLKNVPAEAEETWDRNLKRTIGQILNARGESNPYTLASILRLATAYECRGIRWDLARSQPSDGEQELYFDDNADDLRWANQLVSNFRASLDMYPSPFGFLIYITSILASREQAEMFWIDHFVRTNSIPFDHPAQQLNAKLKTARRNNGDKKPDHLSQLTLGMAAWNTWWNGEDPVKGPWERMKVPSRWHSGNIPSLLPVSYRDQYPPPDVEEETEQ